MHHLFLPSYCAGVVGLMLALLARALRTGADSFALLAILGIAFFAYRCWVEARRCWPAFKAEMQQRRDERQRRPLPADDTH